MQYQVQRGAWLLFTLLVLCGCSRAPQLGSEECLKAADALWTAVTAKRGDLLEACATEIERLHAAAKLPPAAFESLQAIVDQARAGDWTQARIALKSLIRAQRPAAK